MAFRDKLTNPLFVLKVVIALCYMGLGIYLYINSALLYFIDITYRHILAWVFIIYGAFRMVRTLTDSPNNKNI